MSRAPAASEPAARPHGLLMSIIAPGWWLPAARWSRLFVEERAAAQAPVPEAT